LFVSENERENQLFVIHSDSINNPQTGYEPYQRKIKIVSLKKRFSAFIREKWAVFYCRFY
jgi:hypothetical protein